MSSLAYVRWDPKTRAGAVAVRKHSEHDLKSLQAVSDNIQNWAEYQNLAGEHDTVDASPVRGTYDWRGYLQEEAQLAKRREERQKPRDKKVERVAPPPAPHDFYA